MPAQTQESKRSGMEAFLDIFEEFESRLVQRPAWYDTPRSEKIALFAAYIRRME